MDVLKLIDNIKILPNGCWQWQGSKNPDGYGNITQDKKRYTTHRFAYELFVGVIPEGGHVLHSCDNPSCCNPEHLRIGTNYDNVQDRQNRDRQAKGIGHGRHKLTETEIQEIRNLYATGSYIQQELADRFNVSRSHVCNILNNKFWTHIT